MTWKGREIIFLEEIVYTHAQELRNQANVVAVIEPLQQMDTFAVEKNDECAYCNRLQGTYLVFFGSRSLSFCSTRTSILLASRYFGIARMILIATLLFVSVSTASTTFPKVP